MSPGGFFPTEYYSNVIAQPQSGTGLLFKQAKITLNSNNVYNLENIRLFLSANNGTAYEETTNQTLHTFATPGSQLKYKFVGVDASITVNLNKVNTPIMIDYILGT